MNIFDDTNDKEGNLAIPGSQNNDKPNQEEPICQECGTRLEIYQPDGIDPGLVVSISYWGCPTCGNVYIQYGDIDGIPIPLEHAREYHYPIH